jgi:hypothetical protein
MRISKFEKDLSVTGKNGVITGKIVITMNYTTNVMKGTNPSTHDDFKKTIFIHKIEGYINNKIHWMEMDLNSENMVLNEAERCEKKLLSDMHDMANKEREKSFVDKMKDLGF